MFDLSTDMHIIIFAHDKQVKINQLIKTQILSQKEPQLALSININI